MLSGSCLIRVDGPRFVGRTDKTFTAIADR